MSEYIIRHGSVMQDGQEEGITPPDIVDQMTVKHGSEPQDGGGGSVDTRVDKLTEDVKTLKRLMYIYITFDFNTFTTKHVFSHTYDELCKNGFESVKVMYFDTQVTVDGEVSRGNYMPALYVRQNDNEAGGYFEFTFLNHNRNGYMVFRLDQDNVVTKVS